MCRDSASMHFVMSRLQAGNLLPSKVLVSHKLVLFSSYAQFSLRHDPTSVRSCCQGLRLLPHGVQVVDLRPGKMGPARLPVARGSAWVSATV